MKFSGYLPWGKKTSFMRSGMTMSSMSLVRNPQLLTSTPIKQSSFLTHFKWKQDQRSIAPTLVFSCSILVNYCQPMGIIRDHFGIIWDQLGVIYNPLGIIWDHLGIICNHLGPFRNHFRPVGESHVTIWESLGTFWESLRTILDH